jgi:hypothetical protein
MRPLALTIVSAGGRGRAALVVAATALTSGLLLVAVSIVRLWEAGVGPYGAYEPANRSSRPSPTRAPAPVRCWPWCS